MALKKQPPGEKPRAKPIHFAYTGTPKGTQWEAYIAGPCWWGQCHSKGKTKPCLEWLTDGALECPYCATIAPPEETGYLPLWRSMDGKPVCVIVHELSRESVDAHTLHTRVMIGRGVDPTDGVYVIRAMKPGAIFATSMREKMAEADITRSLLSIWKLPALTEWYYRQHGLESLGCHTPKANKPVVPIARPEVVSVPQTHADGPLADVYGDMLRRIKSKEGQGGDSHPPQATG